MQFLLFLAFVVIIFLAYKNLKRGKADKKEVTGGIEKLQQDLQKYRYLITKNPYITTRSEGLFLRRLQEYVKDRDYIICPKVRIGDIIHLKSGKGGFRPYTISSRLDRSHVDFVLIHKSNLTIACAIELDDPSHLSEKAIVRDEAKDVLFSFVQIPLLRFSHTNPTNEEFQSQGLV